MLNMLKGKYYNIHVSEIDQYMIQTKSATQACGVKLPAVHGTDKGVNPKLKSEKQVVKQTNKSSL